MENCIFCKIIKVEIPAEKIYEDEDTFAFLDISPQNKGHTLVVPKKHFKNIEDTPEDELCKVFKAVKKIAPKIKEAIKADAYNIGINNGKEAGQEIEHLHIHIIPRFADDKLKHWISGEYYEGEEEGIGEKIRKLI